MKRTYRGPIIEREVEQKVVFQQQPRRMIYKDRYALAVDDGTGELVLILEAFPGPFMVSSYNPTAHIRHYIWRVTS